jgi:hypothetical protein
MTGVFTGSSDSSIIEDQEYTGKYTVNPDCTSDEGSVATGFEQRVSPDRNSCTESGNQFLPGC